MAVVLSTEERNYFSSSGLRRSHSQPKFGGKNTGFHTSASTSRIDESYHQPVRVYSDSAPSSAPSSPRSSNVEPSELSAPLPPAFKFSFARNGEAGTDMASAPGADQIILPQYEGASFFHAGEDLEPPPSPKSGDSYTASPNDQDTSTNTSRPESPDLFEKAEDDTAVRAQPSRHVDYLSHNWREEDIWESWKYIVSKKGEYSNSARLENASWRTWMKSKNRLKTVSPEALNWLKDCDVTWLYGPLQTGTTSLMPPPARSSSIAGVPERNAFGHKKPILKKRSMSEIMLQRSLSASSLIKQAAAAVQAQQKEGGKRMVRPGLARAATDYITFPFSSRRMSRENTSAIPSAASSGIVSPNGERKHIHFNEQVEQCIAVDVKGDDEDDFPEANRYANDSDSDDGAIMMKRAVSKKRRPVLKRSRSSTSTTDSKTIAMLPSTTLKYREDEDEGSETALKHSTVVYRSPVISPSSSQETLRPSKPSGKLFAVDEDDEDEDEDDEDAEEDDEDDDAPEKQKGLGLGWRSPTKLGNPPGTPPSGLQRSTSSSSLTAEPAGMRRTESGMFMPFEEGEAAPPNEGLLGRVIDTVNTARDIAHVIWNVGWRK